MTNQAKHTPGPWQVETETRGVGAIYNITHRSGLDNDGQPLKSHIATVYPDALCDEHTSDPVHGATANARLIAAAPELLAALRNFTHAPSGTVICACHNRNAANVGLERPCAYCIARTAIARAEGKG